MAFAIFVVCIVGGFAALGAAHYAADPAAQVWLAGGALTAWSLVLVVSVGLSSGDYATAARAHGPAQAVIVAATWGALGVGVLALGGELGRARVVLGRFGLELLSVLALHPVGRRAVASIDARSTRNCDLGWKNVILGKKRSPGRKTPGPRHFC